MLAQIVPSFRMLFALTLLTGVAYPLATWGIAQLAFLYAANGSLVEVEGRAVASALIGQPFDDPKYFWSRSSATSPMPYNAAHRPAPIWDPRNPALVDAVKRRIAALRDADPGNAARIPADLVTASASGLDPHISIAAAEYQLRRVAAARHLSAETIRVLVEQSTQGRTFGVLSEPRVDVVRLNRALDPAAR